MKTLYVHRHLLSANHLHDDQWPSFLFVSALYDSIVAQGLQAAPFVSPDFIVPGRFRLVDGRVRFDVIKRLSRQNYVRWFPDGISCVVSEQPMTLDEIKDWRQHHTSTYRR